MNKKFHYKSGVTVSILFFSIQLLFLSSVWAQAPQKMSYQAVVRDSSNNLITNGNIGLQISIIQGAATGTILYTETQDPVTNDNGLFSIEIGAGNIISGNFSEIDWSEGPFFIETEIDPLGGSDYNISGVNQMLSVPYALFAEKAGNVAPAMPIVIDVDGNLYTTKEIGNQEWMVQNLRTTRFQNGDVIPNITDFDEWTNLTSPAYCVYNDDGTFNEVYGKLYNWYVVADDRNVCPEGWHVPSDEEWTELTDYLGGVNAAGLKMKEPGLVHFHAPNENATNESGFTGIAAGYRFHDGGYYYDYLDYGLWWSTTETASPANAWLRFLGYDIDHAGRDGHDKGNGFSVRCLKN